MYNTNILFIAAEVIIGVLQDIPEESTGLKYKAKAIFERNAKEAQKLAKNFESILAQANPHMNKEDRGLFAEAYKDTHKILEAAVKADMDNRLPEFFEYMGRF